MYEKISAYLCSSGDATAWGVLRDVATRPRRDEAAAQQLRGSRLRDKVLSNKARPIGGLGDGYAARDGGVSQATRPRQRAHPSSRSATAEGGERSHRSHKERGEIRSTTIRHGGGARYCARHSFALSVER